MCGVSGWLYTLGALSIFRNLAWRLLLELWAPSYVKPG